MLNVKNKAIVSSLFLLTILLSSISVLEPRQIFDDKQISFQKSSNNPFSQSMIVDSTQNDANSGGDAGETTSTAVIVDLDILYFGDMGQGYFTYDNEVDYHDCYAFAVPDAGNISVYIEHSGTSWLGTSILSVDSSFGSKAIGSSYSSGWLNVSVPLAGTYYLSLRCDPSDYDHYSFTISYVYWAFPSQNDAGSGTDTGETTLTALEISMNALYYGSMGQGYFTYDNEVDYHDCYAFAVPDAGNISVYIEHSGTSWLGTSILSVDSSFGSKAIGSSYSSGWLNVSVPLAGTYYLSLRCDPSDYDHYSFTISYVYWAFPSQNDAGSGTDAGETTLTAIVVQYDTQYSGTMGQGFYNDNYEVDAKDCYAFTVTDAGNISVYIEHSGTSWLGTSILSVDSSFGSKAIGSSYSSGWLNVSVPLAGTYYLSLRCDPSDYDHYSFTISYVYWFSHGQNDAGSGTDAGETTLTALEISMNVLYYGSMGQGYFTYDNEVDYHDCYAFAVPDAGNISVYIEHSGTSWLGTSILSVDSSFGSKAIGSSYSSGWLNVSVPLAGTYYLSLRCDSSDYDHYSFIVYFYPPIIQINSPLDNVYYASDTVILDYSTSIGIATVFLNNISLGNLPSGSSIANLEDGDYNLTVQVTFEGQNFTTYSLFTIDTTIPTIFRFYNHPDEETYLEGAVDINITWIAEDVNTDYYQVLKNGSSYMQNEWISGSPIVIDLSELHHGTYNFTLVVFDKARNNFYDIIIIHILDQESPSLSPLSDFQMVEDTAGNILSWIADDTNPSYYEIYQNGTLKTSNSWDSSSPISWNIDYLTAGIYNITIIVYDFADNYAIDIVIVTVLLNIPEVTQSSISLLFVPLYILVIAYIGSIKKKSI